MSHEVRGACVGIWRKEPLIEIYKGVLAMYAKYLNRVSASYSIRYMKPDIRTRSEERQIIKAIGFLPAEEIVVCGFLIVLIDSTYEIINKFGRYLLVGAPKEQILQTPGNSQRIRYFDTNTKPKTLRSYHISDIEFVRSYFQIGYDPKIQNICSLHDFTIHGMKIKDLLAKHLIN